MLGTDTVSRKGSTFRPMDTEAKDKDIEATSHYDHLQTGIQYALPLTNQEPEYATPIIERHSFRKDPFLPDPSYCVPGVVLNKSPSFRVVEGSNWRNVIGGLAGSNQMPHVKTDRGNYPEDIYDSPKIQKPIVQNGSCSEYQRPQIKSPVHECYSTPRDCVRLPFSGLRPDPEGSSSDGSWEEPHCDVPGLPDSTKPPPDSNLFVHEGQLVCAVFSDAISLCNYNLFLYIYMMYFVLTSRFFFYCPVCSQFIPYGHKLWMWARFSCILQCDHHLNFLRLGFEHP